MIDPSWQDRLYGYLGGVLENKKGKLICAGGMPDHIHLLGSLPPQLSVSETVNFLKSNSSRWVHQTFPRHADFAWQNGYGAFAVSKSNEDRIIHYIQNQSEHHRNRTFKEEFLGFLSKHGIPYDDRFIWV